MILKKTILFILPDLNQGGAERVITTIINHLDKRHYSPKLVLFRKEGYYLNFLHSDIEIIELKVARIRFSIFGILKLISQQKPDIVFVGWGEIAAFLSPFIPLFSKIKFIARETNVVSKHVTRPEIRFFYRFYNNFHKIIAQSDDMQKDLISNFKINPSKIEKINNPVDFDLIDTKSIEKIELPYKKHSKNVVAIGNLSSRKGFDLLLNVFRYLKEENIHLYILGDGADREELLKQKDNLGLDKVHFIGKVDNPFPYLKEVDLFILSSRYEGFPNVLLEAGACGTYAIANNCPGGINEIIEDKINGEIISIEDEQFFAEKIVETLSIIHNKEKIRKSIRIRFSKEIILAKYNDLLEKF